MKKILFCTLLTFSVCSCNKAETQPGLNIATGTAVTQGAFENDSKNFAQSMPIQTENQKCAYGYAKRIAVGDEFAVYLDDNGYVQVIYDDNNITSDFDYSKKYVALGKDAKWLVAIDEDGKAVSSCPDSAEVALQKINDYVESVRIEGGTYGSGGMDPASTLELQKLTNISQLVGAYHSGYCALLMDQTVEYRQNQRFTRKLENLAGSVQIALSGNCCEEGCAIAGLKEDGTVTVESQNEIQKRTVEQWTNLKQIAAGTVFVGLTTDGTVLAEPGNLNLKLKNAGWCDIDKIAVSGDTLVGLKNDGTVVAITCGTDYGQCATEAWKNIVDIETNGKVTVGVNDKGVCVVCGNQKDTQK